MHNYVPNSTQPLDSTSLMSITAANPVTYQFQVVEYMKDDKIMKVELQVQATTHNSSGTIMNSSGFKPVPRISLPYIDHK